MTAPGEGAPHSRSTRRQFLLGGAAAAGVGAAAAIGFAAGAHAGDEPMSPSASIPQNGGRVVPFHGIHQAGVDTDPQAHAAFVALDLAESCDRDGLRRTLRILTDDASRLTEGVPALADTEPELAAVPARLTVTLGVGPRAVLMAGRTPPRWLRPLPGFGIDRLRPEFSDGDLLLQVAADDAVTVAHAVRMLTKDIRRFATIRWLQSGFRRAYGSEASGTTMRNLFGQVDGTANPRPGTPDFDHVVWIPRGWLAGGTSLVLRRIAMDLDGWDRLDRDGRDQAIGRRVSDGAPLTGEHENDDPDFAATTPIGFPVIPEYSHMRRARGEGATGERIFRRGYNYDGPPDPTGTGSGLLFASFQADPDAQFVPIQRRLADLDIMNRWTTPIGSAVFAVLPGCETGGMLGAAMFA